jgi:transposase
VLSGAFKTISGMAQRFIACDREQSFLMPPDVREWLPEGHLAWFVLDAVAAMDLAAFYAAYREDGRSRPAYEPSMMVTLLLYAYCCGVRSARAIERACEVDVAYRVIAAHTKPDHATIARFVERHEQALAGLFGAVLGLCAQAGLAKVGIVAIDGTKIAANASRDATRDYAQIAREILEEAKATDAAEDELYGEARGDELPEQWRTGDGRREWLRGAKKRLAAERAAKPQPVPRKRGKRLKQAKRRLDEELWTEVRANEQYEAYRARGRMRNRRRIGAGHSVPSPTPRRRSPRGGSTSATPTRGSSRGCAAGSRATTRKPWPTSTRSSSPPRSTTSVPTSGTSNRCWMPLRPSSPAPASMRRPASCWRTPATGTASKWPTSSIAASRS